MIFNFSLPAVEGSIVVFPEWVHEEQPKHPDDIKETIYITGTAAGGRVLSLTGTADQDP